MPKGPVHRIQDSVHGLMEFRGMETLVIDILRTPELQRLRRIRQLGLGHLVFPGAEHSRLVHSLGASWLAVRFGRQLAESARGFLTELLRPSASAVRDLAVAALCHDLGHGPLSHAWEREVVGGRFKRRDWADKLGLGAKYRDVIDEAKWHELVGAALLLWPEGDLHRLLERNEERSSERIAGLLRGQYYLGYLPRILASDVDVDRADFIARDTYQSGVAYGRYDLNWLISTLTVGLAGDDTLVVGFDERKAVRVVEQFLIARQALYETVYYHKTVHAAEGMVALFLRRLKEVVHRGIELKDETLVGPYLRVLRGEPLEPREVLSLDDFSLFVLIDRFANVRGVDPTREDLGRRIIARDLFKLVPVPTRKVTDLLAEARGFEDLCHAIKPFCPGDPSYYLVIDKVDFRMFNDKEEEFSYFIGDRRTGAPIREHASLRGYRNDEHRVRLFTLASAVDAIRDLFRG